VAKKSKLSKKWIECGLVGRPFGVKGQVSIFWKSGMCPVEVGRGRIYTRDADGGYIPHVVLAARQKGKRCIVTLDGVKDPDEAAKLRHEKVYVSADELPPAEENEFYCYQIVGLKVETEEGELIGKVVNVFPTGSNDVYEVERRSKKKETVLLPAIDSVIISIDVKKGKMIVRPMKGMLDQ
jgi:16S rRNA processing protein RimM